MGPYRKDQRNLDSHCQEKDMRGPQCGNDDESNQCWLSSTMHLALHKMLNSCSILITSLWGRTSYTAFTQARKPKLGVAKSRPKGKDVCTAKLACSAGSWLWSLALGQCALGITGLLKPQDSTQLRSLPGDQWFLPRWLDACEDS